MKNKKPGKEEVEKLGEKLMYNPKLVWDTLDSNEKKQAFGFCEEYKEFLDHAKTEREAVQFISETALRNGFKEAPAKDARSPLLKRFREKSVALAKFGTSPLEDGIRLIISHIDAPRLDLKQRPLYEEVDLAFLKTHYYGGVKKYQWLARPLAIHGRIMRADGSSVDIAVGEQDTDPVFTILDLLPHLARKAQYDKKMEEAIVGEKLNLIVGGLPLGDKEIKDRFKLAVLHCLNTTYGLIEEDLISAELEIVPSGRARDVGWDRSLIGAYGQDDRSSAFTSLKALLDLRNPTKTALVLFVDKEEIGSDGATSAKSKFLESVMGDLMVKAGHEPGALKIHQILSASKALSADASGALDPDYQDVHEKRNAARMGYGGCITKFTGHGGKYGANDANAEYMGWLRRLLTREKICWQTGELGKIDEGGGGTVAKFLAVYGMEIIDYGAPILSMHSPFEVTHKGDIYMTHKGYKAFLEAPVE